MAIVDQLKSMGEERFLAIYTELENQGFGPLDKQVAEALHFRPVAVKRLPMAKRARTARQLLLRGGGNAELCYELFGTYLMTQRKELVTGFLDATGVQHEDGYIEDVEDAAPDAGKVPAVVGELDGKFAPEDVTLYLALCCEMWPQDEGIATLWSKRLASEGVAT